jgi:hypothetical protein
LTSVRVMRLTPLSWGLFLGGFRQGFGLIHLGVLVPDLRLTAP